MALSPDTVRHGNVTGHCSSFSIGDGNITGHCSSFSIDDGNVTGHCRLESADQSLKYITEGKKTKRNKCG